MSKRNEATETELAILEVLWERGPSPVREIVDAVYGEHRRSLHATVKSLLDRLINDTGDPGVWRFSTAWHPQALAFRRLLESRGIARMTRHANQALSEGTDLVRERGRVEYFESEYQPTRFVDPRYPRDEVDFTVDGPYSEYNWELFFDSLLYMAERLDEEGRFDDADEIFGLLLDRARL